MGVGHGAVVVAVTVEDTGGCVMVLVRVRVRVCVIVEIEVVIRVCVIVKYTVQHPSSTIPHVGPQNDVGNSSRTAPKKNCIYKDEVLACVTK